MMKAVVRTAAAAVAMTTALVMLGQRPGGAAE